MSLDDEGETKVVSVDRHPVFDKGRRRPCWFLLVIGPDCLWRMGGRLKLSRTIPIESSTKAADDHVSLYMLSDLIVSG